MSEYERQARRDRLAELRQRDIDPFPARTGPVDRIAAIRARWDDRDAEALETESPRVAVAGRLMGCRSFGKLMFLRLLEDGTEIQVSVKKKQVDEATFGFAKSLDTGDFVRVEGNLWRTRTGELTVDLVQLQMLAKALRPLPEKWHGLTDVEARARHRHLDLLTNESARRVARIRSRSVSAMRAFLDARGFLEVETPVLQPLYGGAAARPFTTHHHSYDQSLYLRISDELYLKRLVIGGLDRVYEIGHNFRNEGISRKHNPEFTMMECYQAYADYHDMMELTEEMLKTIADQVLGTTAIEYQGQAIDLGKPWPRVPICDAIRDATGVDVLATESLEDLNQACRAKGVAVEDAPSWGVLVDQLFSQRVEPELIQPTFITDHPVELSPLAKRSPDDPRLVERFEPFLCGMEIGNAFSELNDPIDQRERFAASVRDRESGDEEAHPLDENFLLALEHGMPPTGGLGIGVDRLVMVLADVPSLREVLLFPHVRPEAGKA